MMNSDRSQINADPAPAADNDMHRGKKATMLTRTGIERVAHENCPIFSFQGPSEEECSSVFQRKSSRKRTELV